MIQHNIGAVIDLEGNVFRGREYNVLSLFDFFKFN